MAKMVTPFMGTAARYARIGEGCVEGAAALGAVLAAPATATAEAPGAPVAATFWVVAPGAVVATLATGGLKKTGPEHDTAINDNANANNVAKPRTFDIAIPFL